MARSTQLLRDAAREPGVTTINLNHVRELRTAIREAMDALAITIPPYTHPTLNIGDTVSAADFQELRKVLK